MADKDDSTKSNPVIETRAFKSWDKSKDIIQIIWEWGQQGFSFCGTVVERHSWHDKTTWYIFQRPQIALADKLEGKTTRAAEIESISDTGVVTLKRPLEPGESIPAVEINPEGKAE